MKDDIYDMSALIEALEEENGFLTKVVDTIPPHMYFEEEIKQNLINDKHLSMNKAAEDLEIRSLIKLSAKGKHKRARLDPLQQKSVSQIHEEIQEEKRRKIKKDLSIARAVDVEELQKKFQERLNALQAQRKATSNEIKPKKRKKKNKELKKQKGNLEKQPKLAKSENPAKKRKIDTKQGKPVFNKEGNFLFSKFKFAVDEKDETKKSEYAGKMLKTLLKKSEKWMEKIEKLKSVDPEKAQLLLEKERWKKAIQKSENIKVKDDPILLKKSLKNEKKKKKKSAKVWEGRIEETEKRKEARQEKREKNIKKKKQAKLDRKIKSAKKKGRVIPGF